MFGILQNVAVFFSDSPKRMAFLQDAIRESTPDSNRTKLRQHGQTRWIEQGDALVVLIELYDAVIQALEKNTISCDGKTGSSATKLLAAPTNSPPHQHCAAAGWYVVMSSHERSIGVNNNNIISGHTAYKNIHCHSILWYEPFQLHQEAENWSRGTKSKEWRWAESYKA